MKIQLKIGRVKPQIQNAISNQLKNKIDKSKKIVYVILKDVIKVEYETKIPIR